MSVAWEEGQCYRELCSLGGREGGERSPPPTQPQAGSPSPSGPPLPPRPAARGSRALTAVLLSLCSSTSCCYMHLHACTTNADTATLILTCTYIQAQTYTSMHAYKWRHKHAHVHLCYMPRNTYRHVQTCVDTIPTQPDPLCLGSPRPPAPNLPILSAHCPWSDTLICLPEWVELRPGFELSALPHHLCLLAE